MKTHTFLSTAAVALVVTSGAFAQSRRAQSPRAPILKKTIIKDPRRKIVADRLRRYLAELSKQLTAGVEDFWRRIEVKCVRNKPTLRRAGISRRRVSAGHGIAVSRRDTSRHRTSAGEYPLLMSDH